MMSRIMETMLRIEINALCLAIVAIVAWGEGGRRREAANVGANSFMGMLSSTAVMIVLDTLSWLFDGSTTAAGRGAAWVANLAYYACHTLPILFFILYADFQIFRDPARSRRFMPFLVLPFGLVIAATAATPFSGFLFVIDSSGHYARGSGFPAFAGLSYGVAAFSGLLVLGNRKRVSRKVFLSLLTYPIPVVLAGICQMLFFGLILIWPAMALFLVVASFNIQRAQASTDHLTGAANRRSLDEELESRIQGLRHGKSFGAILVDLDDFKNINDRFGHDTGDRALEDAAAVLRSVVRTDDLVARYGGDEFVIVAGLQEDRQLGEIVERLGRQLEVFNARAGRPFTLALSIGSGLFDPARDGDARAFVARLDALMYEDKMTRKRAASLSDSLA